MPVIEKYESHIGTMRYIMFFCEMESSDTYADGIAVIHDESADPSWAWTLWTLQVPYDEIDDVAVDMESATPKYDTEGYSETFGSLDELLDGLKAGEYDSYDEMKSGIVEFFS